MCQYNLESSGNFAQLLEKIFFFHFKASKKDKNKFLLDFFYFVMSNKKRSCFRTDKATEMCQYILEFA